MTFRIGQKVVCVDGDFHGKSVISGTILPKKGEVYTVRDLFRFSHWIAVRVEEIRNPLGAYLNEDNGERVEAAFPDWRFRPVVERKTDISFAHEILRKATKPARSPALSSKERG